MPNFGKGPIRLSSEDLEALRRKIESYENKHLGGFVKAFPPTPDVIACTFETN